MSETDANEQERSSGDLDSEEDSLEVKVFKESDRAIPEESLQAEERSPSSVQTEVEVTQLEIVKSIVERVPYEELATLAREIAKQYEAREKQKEENRFKLAIASISAIVLIIVAALGFAAYTKDSTLPNTIIAYLLGGGGGIGGAFALFSRRRE